MPNQIPASPEEFDEPAGRMRLLPTTEFAARAAALTTVALPVAMLAASLTAGVPASGAEDVTAFNTTCCPPGIA
ncbi:hypothetical protein [Actinophytocola gossypii]|uniref:Uncharacterized protein n=1 Tax=Actinophytocola gossypii TaxID=2812003 RepID=A0ABT2JC59_9PSEU|nr:hypothetical protein [Actinophytocola gossypii]MCT2585457.1 hypothetical protein [Actinophytocola gossypii]